MQTNGKNKVVKPLISYFLYGYLFFLRRLSKQNISEWILDIKELLKYIPQALLTFFYSIFYPRHFYLRINRIANFHNDKKSNYPYLLRPVPYILAMFIVINAFFTIDNIPIFIILNYIDIELSKSIVSYSNDYKDVLFNIAIAIQALFLPIFLLLSIITIIITKEILCFFLKNSVGSGCGVTINYNFFKYLWNSEFWKKYNYKELYPKLLYYSLNMCLTFPITFIIYSKFLKAVTQRAEAIPYVNNEPPLYVAGVLMFVYLMGVIIFYYLVRPLIYIIFYCSSRYESGGGNVPNLYIDNEKS